MENLEIYVSAGVQLEWLEAYEASLKRHIKAVRAVAERMGVPIMQAMEHDASKWSSEEFPFYAQQFHGNKGDPIGFARAWLHHQNHNPHHWEYWITRSDPVGRSGASDIGCLPMPNVYVREMVADWVGASLTYSNTYSVRTWWEKAQHKMKLHPNTRLLVHHFLEATAYGERFGRDSFRLEPSDYVVTHITESLESLTIE